MVTLDQLRVFVELHKAGSFTNAAKSLHRAQSAVTYAIKSLESELGVSLLDRSGYRSRLTPAGEAIRRKAEQVLTVVHELDELGHVLRTGWEPRIDIVVHGILPIARVMPLLREAIGQEHPTRVSLRVEILGGVLESIESLQPGLVLTPLGLFDVPDAYDVTRLGAISLIPVTSPDHPLADVESPIPMHLLKTHVHLIVSDSAVARQPMDVMLVGADQCCYFPDFYSRLEALRAGLGFAWMPTYFVEQDIRDGRLVPMVVEGQNRYEYSVGVLHRQSPELGPTARLLLDLVKASEQLLPDVPEELTSAYSKAAAARK